jgi:hypothetical protein
MSNSTHPRYQSESWTQYAALADGRSISGSPRKSPFQQKRFFDEYQAWTAVEAITDLVRLLVMPQQKILPAPPKPQDTGAIASSG